MTELSQEARALIEQGRADDSSTSEDRARVRRRLAAQLGGGVFASATVAGVVANASPASGLGRALHGTSTWLKGALAVSAIAGGAAIAYVAVRPVEEPAAVRTRATTRASEGQVVEQARIAEPSTTSAEAPVAPAHEAPVASAADPNGALAPPARDNATRSRRRHRALPAVEATAAPADDVPVVPASAPDGEAQRGSVTAELALLAAAQRALRSGDAHEALALSQQHREQFARGALIEERAGIETLARCKLGQQPEASARAFLARAPSSPLAARVRKECGLE